ncbi:hypothetical protein [Escherichia coli]|uniref:hypothetical protein n=1 Tax=Escherichia coli TaxID=562 RepID=UPI00147FC0AD|nr:hypothetical protein [Escherichia coli]
MKKREEKSGKRGRGRKGQGGVEDGGRVVGGGPGSWPAGAKKEEESQGAGADTAKK